ncbi:MAG: hypothetical protein ACTTKH_06135 [Treponema sp.]
MNLLIALLFPPIAMLYTMVVHKKDFSVASYISGVISGLCALPFSLMLKMEFYTSSNFFLYSFSFFFFFFFLSSIFGLIAYYIFNFRIFDIRTIAVALSGIWSVFLFFSVYEFVNLPIYAICSIFFLSYTVSILFFDLTLKLLSFLPAIYRFTISYVLLLLFSFASCFSFAFWVFKYSPFIYIGLPLIIIFVLFIFMLIPTRIEKKVESLLD